MIVWIDAINVGDEGYLLDNNGDGLFDFVTREIRIRCLPADIPAEIVQEKVQELL